jgi:hypothetical protein
VGDHGNSVLLDPEQGDLRKAGPEAMTMRTLSADLIGTFAPVCAGTEAVVINDVKGNIARSKEKRK